ncbi:MAG: IS3 family transposase [Ruminococcus sp.]|nr:IS3 family transposase [Ruminococcus sp.]
MYRSKITTFKETRRMIDYFIYYYNHQRIQLKTKLTPLELRSQFVA